jgi:predicted small metal-binding protein
MKRFACGDVVPGCVASWVASNDEELIEIVEWHATEAHGVVKVTPELLSAVRNSISAVA